MPKCRGDVQVNWLICALQMLHWFNPVAWAAFHRMQADRETACDALVLSLSQDGARKKYGNTIIKLLEFSSRASWLPGAVGILEDRSQLKMRMHMISTFGRNAYRWSALAGILFAVLGVLTLTDASSPRAEPETADAGDPVRAELANRNLDFELGSKGAAPYPALWGGGGEGYEIVADDQQAHQGDWSGRIMQTGEGTFGTLTGSLTPSLFAGKRVRYSGFMKLEDVDGFAGLWLRADVQDRPGAFYNMVERQINGSRDWAAYSFELDIPYFTMNINFGALIAGKGTLWVDDLNVEIVGEAARIDESDPVAFLNLDFEQGDGPGGFPRMWYGGGENYTLSTDDTDPHGGTYSGRIASDGPGVFGTLTGSYDPERVAGKRIRYSGYLKMKKVTGWSGLWFRADVDGQPAAFNNMQDRQIRGTSDWQEYSFELDVPADTDNINFGALLTGQGEMWVDDLKIEVIGDPE